MKLINQHVQHARFPSRCSKAVHALQKCVAAFGLMGLLILGSPNAFAQDLIQEAQEFFSQGDFKKAAESAQEYIKRTGDTTSPGYGMEAVFYLAFYDYSLGNYEKALDTFKKLAAPTAPASIRERGVFYMADAYLRLGDSLMAETGEERIKQRKEAYDAAELGFKQYVKDFPRGSMLNEANFGLAKTYSSLMRYNDALNLIDALLKSLSKPNPSLAEIYIVVQAYNLKASLTKGYRDQLIEEGKREEAEGFLKKVKEELVAFFNKQTDPTIANDVAFAIGDLLASLDTFGDAIEFYRRIRPKSETVSAQQKNVENLLAEYREKRRACGGNVACISSVDGYYAQKYQQALEKKKEMETKPDPIITALQRVVHCYLGMKRYTEAAIMSRHIKPFSADEDVRNSLKLAVVSSIGNRQPDEAAAFLEEFESKYKVGDPELDSAAFFIGQLYESRNKKDLAIKYYEKSAADYPKGRYVTENLLRWAIILVEDKRAEEAIKKFDAYESAIGEITDQYLYFRGKAHFQLGQWEEAVEHFRNLNERFPRFPLREDAIFSLAVALAQARRPAEAIAELTVYLQDPEIQKSQYRANLYYQLGATYLMMPNKLNEAVKAFEEVIKSPESPLAPHAFLELAKAYAKDKSKLQATLQRLFQFPNAPPSVLAEAHYLQGWLHQQNAEWDKAIEQYSIVVTKYPNEKKAPEAQINIGACYFTPVRAVKNQGQLPPAELKAWETAVSNAIKAYETVLEEFPNSSQAEGALLFLSQIHALKVEEKLLTLDQAVAYFRAFANRFVADKSLQGRVIVALGNMYSLLKSLDPGTREAQALKCYSDAYELSRDAFGSVESYSRFATLLVQYEEYERVIELSEQLLQRRFDNPRDEQMRPYEAHWWLGHAYFLQKEYDKALSHLEKLNDAPWFARFAEAQYEQAFIAETKAVTPGDLQAVLDRYADITRKPGPIFVQALAMMRVGYVQLKQAAAAKPPKDAEFRAAARVTFLRVDLSYPRQLETAAESLYQAAQIYEQEGNKAKAIETYRRSMARGPETEFGKKSKTRLDELGVPAETSR